METRAIKLCDDNDDMYEFLKLISAEVFNHLAIITHIEGLNRVISITLNLPAIRGGNKLVYAGIDMDLSAMCEFAKQSESNPLFAKLEHIIKYSSLWSGEA